MSRLLFIYDFLNGNKQAKLILADMLEEEGQAKLSQRVKTFSPTNNIRKTLIFGINLLPFELCVELAAMFANKALAAPKNPLMFRPFVGQVSQIEAWGRGLFLQAPEAFERTEEIRQLAGEMRETAHSQFKRNPYGSYYKLIDAMALTTEYACDLFEFKLSGNVSKVSSRNNAIHLTTNQVASVCRSIRYLGPVAFEDADEMSSEQIMTFSAKMKWMLDRLKTLLKERSR